jgi:oxygen-independent coproporphyrinogen-3 oxidase
MRPLSTDPLPGHLPESKGVDGGKSRTGVGSYFVANYPPFSFWKPEGAEEGLLSLGRPADPDTPLGLYLHIPFCRLRCKFCYFRVYAEKNSREVADYVDALAREVEMIRERTGGGRPVRFVYFGGGTPSYLSSSQLRGLAGRLQAAFPWDRAEEVTFECEPGTITRKKLEAIREIGVTRLSLGVESFDDGILEANGRAHRSAEILRSWNEIRNVGFPQVNIDLIAGMVGGTEANWLDGVRQAIDLAPDSVTIYQMELPWNTEFSRQILQGSGFAVASWDEKRAWADLAFRRLEAAGYGVSSGYTLVRTDREVRFVYRDALWRGADMIGAGVASFSHVGGVHFQNADRIEDYVARVREGRLPVARGLAMTKEERAIRELVLQLKLGAVDASYFRTKFGIEIVDLHREALEDLWMEGLLSVDGDRIVLTRAGLLRVDEILPRFFLPLHRGARYT